MDSRAARRRRGHACGRSRSCGPARRPDGRRWKRATRLQDSSRASPRASVTTHATGAGAGGLDTGQDRDSVLRLLRELETAAAVERRDAVRGKGIASPDKPREPKQSWRPQGPTGLDVRDHDRAPSLLNPDSEQAGSRSCVGRDRTDGRHDLDQVAAARLGRSGRLIAAAISAAPVRPFRQLRGPWGRRLLTLGKRASCVWQGATRTRWTLDPVVLLGRHRAGRWAGWGMSKIRECPQIAPGVGAAATTSRGSPALVVVRRVRSSERPSRRAA